MDKGDKVQAKKHFRLKNAIVDKVLANGIVQVQHDIWWEKWCGQRPQLHENAKKERILCRFVDLFDIRDLVVTDG
jgi:hypothetical protein